MTYIDYLNTFHQWCESNTLPVNSRLLYMNLLHVFNRAGWPENVRVDTLRLMVMIGATDKRVVYRARDALIDAGLIHYEKGKKGSPGIFWLCDFSASNGTKKCTTNGTENSTLNGTESGTENGTHIKTKNKTKTKTNIPPLIPPQGETGFGPALQKSFEAWIAYKQEKRQGYKPTGLKSLITQIRNNADKYGEQAVADLIERCMASNWQGIIFDILAREQSIDGQKTQQQKPIQSTQRKSFSEIIAERAGTK